jgi:multidrug efflux system outer membrane protein
MNSRIALLFAAALALAGCASRIAPPPAATLSAPAHWRVEIGPDNIGAAVERRWWAAFGDPSLSALVDEALRNNGDLRIAGARMAAAKARVTIAGAAQLPVVSGTVQPARARSLNAFGQPVVADVFQAGVQASYEVDVWGRLAQASASALSAYQAERANTDAVALSIAASVATGYLNLRGLDAQLSLADATLALREQSLAFAHRQFAVGYSSRLEKLQAQTEYDVTAELIPQLRRSIFDQENALAILAGRNPGAIVRGRDLAELAPPPVPVGLPSELLRRRPDIYRAAQNVVAQQANLAAVADQMLPSFRLTAAGGAESFHLHELINAPTALWNVAIALAAPLYEGGRQQAATDAAAAQRDEAIYIYENVVRSAFSETENGLQAVARLREQAKVTAARRDTATEAFAIAHRRHANGYASYLEELDAQRTVYSAEVGVLQLQAQSLIAAVDLYRAMGGGWSVDSVARP